MGQFGLHAIVSLLLTSFVVPKSLPSPARWWIGAGVYLGCVFPDLDVYPEAVVIFFNSDLATQQIHRTFLHSLTVSFIIFIFLLVIQAIYYILCSPPSHSLESEGFGSLHSLSRYSSISEPAPAYYALNVQGLPDTTNIPGRPVLSRRHFLPNLHRFGFGLLLGTLTHILIDIVIWFSFVDILWPLNLFPSLHVGRVDIWKHTQVPSLVMDILTVSELWCVAVFFSLLRMVCKYQMRFIVGMNENLEAKCGQKSDELRIQQGQEVLEVKEGGGGGTLKRKIEGLIMDKKRLLTVLLFIEILHYIYGIVIGIMLRWMIDGSLAFKMVYDVLLCLSMPLFYFFSFRLKDLILW